MKMKVKSMVSTINFEDENLCNQAIRELNGIFLKLGTDNIFVYIIIEFNLIN